MQYSVVNYSKVNSIFDFRIDGEYWQSRYLRAERYLSAKGVPVKPYLNKIRCGPFGATLKCETYLEDGVIVVRPFNINNYQFELNNLAYISHEDCKNKGLDLYKDGDILFSRVGDVKVGIIPDTDKAITISPNIIAISVKNELLSPYYCCVFFNSKFGLPQIQRGLKVVAQPTISTELIKQLSIIILSAEFQHKIQDIFLHSLEIKKESESFYTQAQTLLLSELGLAGWQPKNRLTFVTNYSEMEPAERIDADYFQPKYEEIVHAIKSYSGGWAALGNLVTIKKCVEVGSKEYLDEGIPFVRVSNLSPFEITEEKYISEALYAEIRQHQPKQGEILLSKDATPGIAHYLRQRSIKMIPSGGILRLKSKTDRINNEYLTLVLNSILTKEQVNRDVGGSLIPHWRPDQVRATVIPILPEEKQIQIQQKVIESLNLRKKSKHLLECAKRAVEIAIEQDEQTAIDYLAKEAEEIEQ